MTDPQNDVLDAAAQTPDATEGLAETALVEEVSIDGMCGVY